MKNYDVIALLCSAVPYAYNVYESKLNSNPDTNFFTLYPVKMTVRSFKELNKTNYENKMRKIESKLHFYNNGLHIHIDDFIKRAGNITEEQLKYMSERFEKWNKWNYTTNDLKLEIQSDIWFSILKNLESTYKISDISELEFIESPDKRFSGTPDPSRTALLVDDYLYRGDTLVHSVFDMFKLGYKNIEFTTKTSNYDFNNTEGDFETYQKLYADTDVKIIERDIVKTVF